MILEEMFNGKFYPCETVVADSFWKKCLTANFIPAKQWSQIHRDLSRQSRPVPP